MVSERSMAPALEPGQILLGVRQHRPRRGRLVCLRHPYRDEFWLVKRVVGLPGPLPIAGSYGVVRVFRPRRAVA